MRYLCLIYIDEKRLAAVPQDQMDELNRRHLELNEELLATGHFIEAEALTPAASATCVRPRNGRHTVTDGPYAETKEMVAGFYLVEARDLNEAIRIASLHPAAHLGEQLGFAIEVRPVAAGCHQ